MVVLTGKRTWFMVIEVANALLDYGQLSQQSLTETIREAEDAHHELRHDYEFEDLQGTRDLMLSRGSEPIAKALGRAVELGRLKDPHAGAGHDDALERACQ